MRDIQSILNELKLDWMTPEGQEIDEGVSPNLIESAQKNEYVFDVHDSREFGKIYTKLDLSDKVRESNTKNLMSVENIDVQFEGNGYTVNLIGDLDQDSYKW